MVLKKWGREMAVAAKGMLELTQNIKDHLEKNAREG